MARARCTRAAGLARCGLVEGSGRRRFRVSRRRFGPAEAAREGVWAGTGVLYVLAGRRAA